MAFVLWVLMCGGCAFFFNSPSGSVASKGVRNFTVMKEITRLSVRVKSYETQVIHDDFIDGSSNSYGLTMLAIIAPDHLSGRELNVIHSMPLMDRSIWMAIGKECVVEVEGWLLDNPDIDVPPESIKVISCM